MGATVGFMHGITMEMLRFPGTSSSVWAPKIVALMGLSPFDLTTLQRERLHFPSGQLLQAVPSPSARTMKPAITMGAVESGTLCCSCQLKSFCISFMSNQLAEK